MPAETGHFLRLCAGCKSKGHELYQVVLSSKIYVMNGEAKKLHLIEAILKVEDEALLNEVESLLARGAMKTMEKKSLKDFSGIWTEEEAEEMKKFIEESCEQINPDDWK
jgi:hypothetical protein